MHAATSHRSASVAAVLLLLVSGLAFVPSATALPINLAATAPMLGAAMQAASSPGLVTGAAWVAYPPSGTPTGVADGPRGTVPFPTEGATFAVLTTGNAAYTDTVTPSTFAGVSNGGSARGARDVVILRVDLNVPAGHNFLAFDFQFLSEEYPTYVGSPYNDGFLAELDSSTWSASGSGISAPNNFATDNLGNRVEVNAASMTGPNGDGTVYGGATCRLRAFKAVTPGAHSLYLSIFDQGDSSYDSAVWIDNLRTFQAATATNSCNPAVDFSWSAGPCAGDPITFSDLTNPADGPVSSTWTWGDGTTTTLSPWASSTTHTYAAPGTYAVVLTVAFSSTSATSAHKQFVTVPACVDFTWSEGCQGTSILFQQSEGPAGSSVTWTWGDGSSTTVSPWAAGATHAYAASGTYSVTMSVAYPAGTYSKTRTVTVLDCARTYAAGDVVGTTLFVTGDDPGCGLGTAGSAVAGSPTSNLAIDVGTGAAAFKASMPQARFLHGAVAQRGSAGGTVLVVGAGTSGCSFPPLSSVDIYDPASDSWTPGPAMPTARIEPAVAAMPAYEDVQWSYWAGGDATGGDPTLAGTAHTPTPAMERFDGTSWSPLKPMPAGVVGARAAVDGFMVHVTGGFSHPQSANRLVQSFDTLRGTWRGPHLPVDSYVTGHAAAFCDNRQYVVGGVADAEAPMHKAPGSLLTSRVWVNDGTPEEVGWSAGPSLPRPLAYPAATALGPWLYLHGGYTATGGVSDKLYRLDCTLPGSAAIVEMAASAVPPLAAPPARAESALEASGALLYLFGGTPTLEPTTLGGAPVGDIFAIDPALGTFVKLPVSMPPTAAMGSAVLPDGRIMLVGGRTSSGGSDHVPSSAVYIFDPILQTVTPGPPLPVGLIGPAVIRSGSFVYVAGGDDQGDNGLAPSAPATAVRPFHPHGRWYRLQVGIGTMPTGPWMSMGEMPMGVVHGRFVHAPASSADGVWLLGGSHHPGAAVRLAQEFTLPASAWPTMPRSLLPQARAHHTLEACNFQFVVHGGVTTGSGNGVAQTVYHTDAASVRYAPANPQTTYRLDIASPWSVLPAMGQRAFAVGHSGIDIATGTAPAAHRTMDFASIC